MLCLGFEPGQQYDRRRWIPLAMTLLYVSPLMLAMSRSCSCKYYAQLQDDLIFVKDDDDSQTFQIIIILDNHQFCLIADKEIALTIEI